MAIVETPKKLCQVGLTTSAATIMTVATGASVVIKTILVHNYHASTSTTVTLWNGLATNQVNRILPTVTLAAGEHACFDGVITLGDSEFIAGQAGASSCIAVTIYGVEFTEA